MPPAGSLKRLDWTERIVVAADMTGVVVLVEQGVDALRGPG